jgi:soluble lytic murein transglycosylase-like protein
MRIINKRRFTIFICVVVLCITGLIYTIIPKPQVKSVNLKNENSQKVEQSKNKEENKKPQFSKKTIEAKNKPIKLSSRGASLKTNAKIYDVKLSSYLQTCTYYNCKKYGVDYELALAVMFVESSFNPNAYNSRCGDFGLMQINKQNHKWLSQKLGIADFFDAEQNIKAGVYMLSLNKDEGYHFNLMSYNMGEPRTVQLYDSGIYTSKYSLKVMDKYYQLKETGTIK